MISTNCGCGFSPSFRGRLSFGPRPVSYFFSYGSIAVKLTGNACVRLRLNTDPGVNSTSTTSGKNQENHYCCCCV